MRRRQRRPDHGEHRQGEGDVGGGGDGPAAGGVALGAHHRDGGEEDQRGHDDPADGRDHRDDGLGRGAQVADEELALELQPRHEEEDRQQAVAGPVADGELEVAPLDAEHGVAQGEVGIGPRGVRDDQGRDRRTEEQGAADGLGAQRVGDHLRLGPAGPVQDGRPGRGGRARVRFRHACSPAVDDTSHPARSRRRCRPDFPALRRPVYRRPARASAEVRRPPPARRTSPARRRRPRAARAPCRRGRGSSRRTATRPRRRPS